MAGEGGGEGREGGRGRAGGRESWGTVGGVGGGEGVRSPRLGLSVKPPGDPCRYP